jgi:hypothetical protein
VFDEGLRSGGEYDLSTVARRSDPCGPVNIEPDVVVAADPALPRMKTHAAAHAYPLRPGGRRNSLLGLCRCGYGSEGRRKCGEERIPLGPDLRSTVAGDRGPHESIVGPEQQWVLIRELSQVAGRSFDIGEEKRHRTGWQARIRPQRKPI